MRNGRMWERQRHDATATTTKWVEARALHTTKCITSFFELGLFSMLAYTVVHDYTVWMSHARTRCASIYKQQQQQQEQCMNNKTAQKSLKTESLWKAKLKRPYWEIERSIVAKLINFVRIRIRIKIDLHISPPNRAVHWSAIYLYVYVYKFIYISIYTERVHLAVMYLRIHIYGMQ